ncbi:MAG: ATP-dependent DNA helicase RecG [Spirochaetaceae bacterium]|nr:MAG: ATP-dependent DNA helicase RecG [Spirochaetaceae bacterium]
MILAELDQSVRELKGVGPAAARSLARLGISAQRDLLLHLPRAYEDRVTRVSIAESLSGRTCNTVAEVVAHDYIGRGAQQTLKVYVRDESATAALACFGRNFLGSRLPPGLKIRLAAQFSYRYGEPQASAFEFEAADAPPRHFGRILAVYPLTDGLSQALLRSAVDQVLRGPVRHIEDVVPPELRRQRQSAPIGASLRRVHQPESLADAESARRSLAYEELLVLQLRLRERLLMRSRAVRPSRTLPLALQQRAADALPFDLTADQRTVLSEIHNDMQHDRPMARLLQGDVGCGKTLVALLSALTPIEAGGQAVLMAPTELLARQHAENAVRLLEPLGVRVVLLTGSVNVRARRPLLNALAGGEIDLVIGTHAVFSESTRFHDLRYVIVDEQHRFGVVQRAAVLQKGSNPDLLLMTATPIPRTLALTLFGDMETSTIRTMPPGRKPVHTHLARLSNEDKVYARVRRELAAGRQAYFVYPLIDPNDRSELRNAETMFERLRDDVFSAFEAALVHSRVPEEEKLRRMKAFQTGTVQLLVATSVIEVGVDVPNATCMVVEHAERFGLAALHQLRGRVGRGKLQSYAFLVYADDLSEEAKQRLRVLHKTSDGFAIAEQDLQIRGPGDLVGLRQSGFLRLHAADLSRDQELLIAARDDAAALRSADPELLSHPLLTRVLSAHERLEGLAL